MKIKLFGILFALVLVVSFTLATAVPVMADSYVDDDNCPGPGTGTLADPYCSIQDAIDAASPSDTINVAAGTYTEYLIINKDNLTIEGAGIDQCIIDLDGLEPYWHYRGQHGGSPSKSYASRSGVRISGYGSPDEIVEDVTFKGFTVKNAGLNPPITTTGSHTGGDNAAVLTDATASWTPGALVGQWVHNYGDRDTDYDPARSYGQITANTATTLTVTLTGGKENDWDTGDAYIITSYEHFFDQFYDYYRVHRGPRESLRGIAIANGKDILIQNCKVENNGYGGISATRPRIIGVIHNEGVTVDSCIVKNHYAAGIGIGDYKGPVTITDNVCENNKSLHVADTTREYRGYGIQVVGRSKTKMASGLISGNTCKKNGYQGIILKNYSDGVIVENNTVTGHNLDQDGAGIFFYGKSSNPAYCKNNIIRNNKVEKNIRGIVAYYAEYCTIEDNKIKTDSGVFPKGQEAIKIDGGNNMTVKNNTISCDGVGIGVSNTWNDVESYDNTFTGNSIKKAKFAGIRIRSGAHDNDFMYNTIKDTKLLTRWAGETYEETQGDGVIIDDSAGYVNVFNYNNIYNNDDDGMEDQVSTADATCNWWGHYTGPSGLGVGIGDAVYGVYYDPWLALPVGSVFEIEKAKITFKEELDDDKAHVKGQLGQVCGSGVSISDDVIVEIGGVSWTIPGGSMVEKGNEGEEWEYKRPGGDTFDIKDMKIDWKKGKFDVHMDKADLSGLTGPNNVTISIEIDGNDFGEQTIDMTEKDDKWEY